MKFFFNFYILFLINFKVYSQTNKVIDRSLIIQKEIFVPEIKCIKCKKIIESFLLRNEGIIALKTDLSKKYISISYIKGLTNPDEICVAIANSGFKADTVTANEDSRKLLPICCKDTFTNESVKLYYDLEKDSFRKRRKRYREPKKFICCRSCDIVVKYRNLTK